MDKDLGLVHIYCGDGKGKTTAAIGLAIRALGSGLSVVIVQFLKDGTSGELNILKKLSDVTIFANEKNSKFSFQMNDIEKAECKKKHMENFACCLELCKKGKCDLLILDEAFGAINAGLFDEDALVELIKLVKSYSEGYGNIEIVMTGRNPSNKLIELADYVSEISKLKHPFDEGVFARKGIEK